jgi:arginase family enzyme
MLSGCDKICSRDLSATAVQVRRVVRGDAGKNVRQMLVGTVGGGRRRSLSWLDIQKHGTYSEVTLDQGVPAVLCQGVVARDCGDVQCEAMTLAEMVEQVAERLTTEFFRPGVYPLIVGGDHAITYPIVRAHLANTPNLGLLHLDAHNDLFYTPHLVYSHTAPVSNLIRGTRIERVVSFGLRTFLDTRMVGLRAIYNQADASTRIRLRSLTATKQLIMDPPRLEEELRALADRPYYISLDLDVLSEAAIGRRVSTPFGVGLEWHELLTFLVTAFRCLDVVGVDIVEFNGLNGEGGDYYRYYVNSLLLIVIDGLARGNPKFRSEKSIPPLAAAPEWDGNADR